MRFLVVALLLSVSQVYAADVYYFANPNTTLDAFHDGNNTYDGKQTIHCSSNTGFTVAGTTTKTVSKTGAFTDLILRTGVDTLQVTDGSANTGLYYVATVDSDNQVTLGAKIAGTDIVAGAGASIGTGPWATLQKCIDSGSGATAPDFNIIYLGAGTFDSGAVSAHLFNAVTADNYKFYGRGSGSDPSINTIITGTNATAVIRIHTALTSGDIRFESMRIKAGVNVSQGLLSYESEDVDLTLTDITFDQIGYTANTYGFIGGILGVTTQNRDLVLNNCAGSATELITYMAGYRTVTMTGCNFSSSSSTVEAIKLYCATSNATGSTFTNSTIAGGKQAIYWVGDGTRNNGTASITNCTISNHTDSTTDIILAASNAFITTLTITNSRISHLGVDAHTGVEAISVSCSGVNNGVTGKVEITNNTINTKGGFLNLLPVDTTIGDAIIKNNTITCGNVCWSVVNRINRIQIIGNTINLNGTVDGTSAAGGMIIGPDAATGTNMFNSVEMVGNTVTGLTQYTGHGLEIGHDVVGATVSHNRVIGTWYGIVIKGTATCVQFNDVYNTQLNCQYSSGWGAPAGAQGLYICGGDNNNVHHNTVYSSVGTAFLISSTVPSGHSQYNNITDNIFVASGSGNYCFSEANNSGDGTSKVDRNIYWPINNASLATLDGSTFATLALLQAKWDTLSFPLNDENSLVKDPMLTQIAQRTGRIALNSPARRWGTWWNSCIGSWQRGEMVGREPFWRLSNPTELQK